LPASLDETSTVESTRLAIAIGADSMKNNSPENFDEMKPDIRKVPATESINIHNERKQASSSPHRPSHMNVIAKSREDDQDTIPSAASVILQSYVTASATLSGSDIDMSMHTSITPGETAIYRSLCKEVYLEPKHSLFPFV